MEELEPTSLFDSFSDKLEVRETEIEEKNYPQRIIKINLLPYFEKTLRRDLNEKSAISQSKESLLSKALSTENKENRHPNLIHKFSNEKDHKLTPRSFLRKNESIHRPFCDKEKSVFRRLENPLLNFQPIKKIPMNKHSDRTDNRIDHSKVLMLSKLIREAGSRVNSSINCKKEEVYSVLYGSKTSKASHMPRTNSHLLDAFNKGSENLKPEELKPPRPISKNKNKLQTLFSLKSNESSNNSRVENTFSFLKRNERSFGGVRYQSQNDLFKLKASTSKDHSLNNIKQKCITALSQLRADTSVDHNYGSNIMDCSTTSNNGYQRPGKALVELNFRKGQSSFSHVLQHQAKTSKVADHHNIYRHFRQLLEAKDPAGSSVAIR